MQSEQRTKLTQRHVASLKPEESDAFRWDAALPGFGVRVKPSGAKTFVLWYRTKAGTKRLYTIGSGNAYRVEQARREAQEWLVKIRRGVDPVAERKKARQAKTISELCDRYLKEHVGPKNKPRTAKEVRRIVEKKIKPRLGLIPVTELTRARIKDWHATMGSTPFEANRALAYLSTMMSLAAGDWELRPDNPCRGIKKYPEAKRSRYLSGEELRRLGQALRECEHAQLEVEGVIAAIRLLALTGCRLSEITNLTWDHVHLDAGMLALPDAKAGARSVPLGAPAIALFQGLSREEGEPVLHKGDKEPLSISTMEKAWQRICRRAGIAKARLHDLRHTVGTYAGQAGLNAFMVRDLLGHKTLAMTGRYVERDTDPKRAAADHIAGRIAAAMNGTPDAEIVPLSRARTGQ